MRLAFVVQRYGLDIAGGAEYHCRLVAEHLSRHAEVAVLTTCARDYVTWANHYPEGEDTVNGIPVRRFPVDAPRDTERFARLTARLFGEEARVVPGRVDLARARVATERDALMWLDEQGPRSRALLEHLCAREREYDFVLFFSYRYWTTWHGVHAVPGRAVLVPTAEDDGAYHLPIYPPLFRAPRAVVYNSPEERGMISRVSSNDETPGEVVGVGSELPSRLDPAAFRRRSGIEGPFVLYVGRIDLNKGCPQLFEFFLRFRAETGSPLKLVLIGGSQLEIPQDPGIVPLGFRPDEDKWNALAASELFVMPSRLESLCMAVLEAFWTERPVLVDAKCEVLRGQCKRANAGLYYATYDEFRESLSLLAKDAALRQRMGRNGRAYFERNYAWDVVERKYLDLLGRLQSEGRAA
jgi:glycosyltransferase involved in cell wall biosynthesis